MDYIRIILAMIIKFGDGIEIYLLGVITQKVSCELGVSGFMEGMVSVTFFTFFAISTMAAVPLTKRFGDRIILLVSLYTTIMFSLTCALLPNYYTLILSRSLIGLCVGLNSATVGVFVSKQASSKEVADLSLFMKGGIALTLGGGWVSILGWLILDAVEWHNFIIFTSLPFFVPAVIILHCCTEKTPDSDSWGPIATESTSLISKTKDYGPHFSGRVMKTSIFIFCNVFLGYGIILLLPSIIRYHKTCAAEESLKMFQLYKDSDTDVEVDHCRNVAVQGNDLLILAAVSGGANAVGRPLGYFLRNVLTFRVLQSSIAFVTALSYSIILFKPGLTMASVLMGVATLSYSIQDAEVSIIPYDLNYFGSTGIALGAAIITCVGMFGAILGTSLAAFSPPNIAVLITLLISVTQMIVIYFMGER